MRLRVKRRKMWDRIIKISIATLILICVYLFMRSDSKATDSSKNQPIRTRLLIVEHENDIMTAWQNLSDEIDLSPSSGTLISFTSMFPNQLHLLSKFQDNNHLISKQLLRNGQTIDFETIPTIVTGLFEKYIWIYPMWLPDNRIMSHTRQQLGVNEDKMCICLANTSTCQNISPWMMNAWDNINCELIDRSWDMVAMQEIYALTSLSDISVPSPTVVIINLNFFTQNETIQMETDPIILNRIHAHLNAIFCIYQLSDELAVDSWFRRLIQYVHSNSHLRLGHITKTLTKLVCDSQTVNQQVEALSKELGKLTRSQLIQLILVGVCANEIPFGGHRDKPYKLAICQGYHHSNFGSSFLVQHMHSCVDQEYVLQLRKVVSIFEKQIKQPLSVIIVRSARTGLISHKTQDYLEENLVRIISNLYHIPESDVRYGDNLLGGMAGWFRRFESGQPHHINDTLTHHNYTRTE